MEERRVDQHQSSEAQCKDWPFGRDGGRNHTQDDDQRIGDVEVFPTRREVEYMARPTLPVEDELFEDVDCVGGGAKPKQRRECRHGRDYIACRDEAGFENDDVRVQMADSSNVFARADVGTLGWFLGGVEVAQEAALAAERRDADFRVRPAL
jgi:hypothetical protein